MGSVIDILLVCVYGFLIYLAAKRGFVLTAISLIGSILAMFISFKIAGSLAAWVYESFLHEGVLSFMLERFPLSISSAAIAVSPNDILASLPDYISSLVSRFDLLPSAETFESLGEMISVSTLEAKIVAPIATAILKMLCFAVLFIILLIIFKIIAKLMSSIIKKIPLVKTANTALGAGLGALKGLITMTLICVALIAVTSFIAKDTSFALGVTESKICSLVSSMFGM